MLCNRYAVNVFSADQWVFEDATVFEQHSLLEVFRWQHGPHRQGLGAVIETITGPITNWNSRFQGFVIVAIICVSCLFALWLKKRLFGSFSYTDAAIPIIFLTPLHYQVFLQNVNPSHGPLPLLLITLYCLALTIAAQKWRVLAVLLVNFLLIFTGFGLLMGILTPILFLFEFWKTKSRWYLGAAAVAGLCFASFFIGYKYLPAATCFSPVPSQPLRYFLFAGLMFATFVGANLRENIPIAIFTAIVLITVVLWSWGRMLARLRTSGEMKDLIVTLLLSYSLLFAFVCAYGRVCISFAQAQSPRYTTYLVLGYLGLYLGALTTQIRFERWIFVSCVGIIALCSIKISKYDLAEIESSRLHKQLWRDCYLQHKNLGQCDAAAGYAICSDPEPPDLQRKLDLLEKNHWNLFAN